MAETWFDALESTLPEIETDKTSLSFEVDLAETSASAQVLKTVKTAANPSPQTLRIRNSGEGTLSYKISTDKNWLSVSPENGDSNGEWDDIQVFVDISGLSPGSYSGKVTITADYATNSPQEISVTLTIRGPRIKTDKSSLSFASAVGGDNPSAQTFTIRNSGAETLKYELATDKNWLSISPESGESTGEEDEIQVAVNTAGLSRGTYTGTITITAATASNSPQTVSVTLTIRGPRIEANQSVLSFEAVAGEDNPASQTFTIKNSGEETLHYQISIDKDWLSVSPENGESTGEWDEIQVAVDIANLSRDTHSGKITISSDLASNSPQTVSVTLTIRGPRIEADKTSLSFEAMAGEDNPPAQTLKIRNSGEETLSYQISKDKEWLSVTPESGESTGEWDEIQIAMDIANLPRGTYAGKITITGEFAANSPLEITVELTVRGPIIELDTVSLSFEAVADGDNPPPQTFTIRNSGEGTLEYQIAKDKEWMSISPEAGESTGEADDVQVAVDISGLNQDNYQGTVAIGSLYASNNPQQLTISLHIEFPPLFAPADFHGEKKRNRSLSMIEYLNELKWQAHPQNTHIVKYRLYLVEDGIFTILEELNSQTFEYRHRKVDKDKAYTYGLTAVDKWDRESQLTLTEVR